MREAAAAPAKASSPLDAAADLIDPPGPLRNGLPHRDGRPPANAFPRPCRAAAPVRRFDTDPLPARRPESGPGRSGAKPDA